MGGLEIATYCLKRSALLPPFAASILLRPYVRCDHRVRLVVELPCITLSQSCQSLHLALPDGRRKRPLLAVGIAKANAQLLAKPRLSDNTLQGSLLTYHPRSVPHSTRPLHPAQENTRSHDGGAIDGPCFGTSDLALPTIPRPIEKSKPITRKKFARLKLPWKPARSL